jgi:glutamyl-tRNA reductase
MTVVAIGLNHRSAPPATLERLAVSADSLPKALGEITGSDVVTEAVVISTCNRTEVYVHAERFHDGFRDVREALALLSGADPESFDDALYVHYHDEAARHLFRVAAGLDSLVLGEHEVLGQVAKAWESARAEGTSGPVLNLLFQRAVEAGKKVRTHTDIGRSTASLSHAAVSLIEERYPIDNSSVLLIGAGELGASVASALSRKHRIDLTVANRTKHRADMVAAELDAGVVPFADLPTALGGNDIVITATGASEPVLTVDGIAAAVTDRDLLILDLALPRDVPADAGAIPGVDLVELPELQAFANRGLEERKQHVAAADDVVVAELERYQAASSARRVAPLIGGLHAWADSIRAGELDRYASRLAAMGDADREAIEALSRSIVAKMLHSPTITVKDAAGTARGERLAEAVRELFDLS